MRRERGGGGEGIETAERYYPHSQEMVELGSELKPTDLTAERKKVGQSQRTINALKELLHETQDFRKPRH